MQRGHAAHGLWNAACQPYFQSGLRSARLRNEPEPANFRVARGDCSNFGAEKSNYLPTSHPRTNYHSWFLAPRANTREMVFPTKHACPSENAFSYSKMRSLADMPFLHQNAHSCRKMQLLDQVSDGNSYSGEPGQTKNGSHCSFQDLHSLTKENQVSLLRIFLPQPDPDRKSTDLGVGGGKMILIAGGLDFKSPAIWASKPPDNCPEPRLLNF